MRRKATAVLAAIWLVAQVCQGGQARPRARPTVALPGKVILQEHFEKGIEGWACRRNGELKWIDDPAQARQSRGCLMGKVEGDRKANFFERELEFKKSSIYRFVVWARADRPGKLVLWSQQGKQRRMLGAWRYVAKRWRRYECQFSMPTEGAWMFQLIVPSSHGEQPCTMWVDDMELHETELPAATTLTGAGGYHTEPSLAADESGAVWAAWLSYHEGRDRLMVGRMDSARQALALAAQWETAMPKDSCVLGSALVADRVGAWLLCAAEAAGNWDVYACRVGQDGPSTPQRVTTHPAVDARPAGAVLQGKLWVAWESNRDGKRQVYMRPLDGQKLHRLSSPDANSYSPVVASHEGALWVAWHAYADGNYDLYGLRVRPEGDVGPVQRLTRDGNIDRHAQLLSCSHGLWIAWQRELVTVRRDEITTRDYRTGYISSKESMLCRWSQTGLTAAAGLGKTILSQGTERPALAADAQNRVWVTARRARGQSAGWDSVLQCFAGGEWGEPKHLSTEVGWDCRAAIVAVPGQVIVAYQVGKTPSFRTIEDAQKATSEINLAAVSLRDAPQPATPQVEDLRESTDAHWLAKLRQQVGEHSPSRTIEYEGKTLRLLWGDLHEHSSISQCNRWKDVGPDDSYAHERDIVNADFTCLTDHGFNFCPGLWRRMGKIVRINHDPGRFVAFLGEEWTSSIERYSDEHPAGFYGHRNLIFADPYFPRWFNARDEATPRQLWDRLQAMDADFVNIPHQLADTGNVPTDWNFVDERAQPVAEIFQARQSYEYKGAPRQAGRTIDGYFLQDAWAKGIVIGVIASPDHGGGQGKAAVYATELTRGAILGALRARRCYGTTAARIFLDFRVNGRMMGEKVNVKRGQKIVATAKVIGANELERVELCRSNQFIYSKPGNGRDAAFEYTDLEPVTGRSYYYVRVQQKDGELAWSSPVWVSLQ